MWFSKENVSREKLNCDRNNLICKRVMHTVMKNLSKELHACFGLFMGTHKGRNSSENSTQLPTQCVGGSAGVHGRNSPGQKSYG